MRPALTILIIMCMLCMAALVIAAGGPDKVVFEAKKGTVRFDHTTHHDRVGECEKCHHNGVDKGPCRKCHDGSKAERFMRKSHIVCRNCHKTRGASSSCNFCHQK
ncbi:MAG: cytochrome c3 family protein [Nitrospirota bacterium]|nr:MAG: cytochrome c3 family protein [Nitrospirota bacterium]